MSEQSRELLSELIRYASLPGQEQPLMERLAQAFSPVVDELRLLPMEESLPEDPEYSRPLADLHYGSRSNLRALLRGSGRRGGEGSVGGHSLIVNAHVDVVPPSEGQEAPFEPRTAEGYVYGRGACDDKGGIAALWGALSGLKQRGLRLDGDLILHLVAEEENGGNGTLALLRRGEEAEAVLVLEPTELSIVPSSRGSVWFRITCKGRPAHVGSSARGISALRGAVAVMGILEGYHSRLLAESGGLPLFEEYENPMPLTFGRLVSGSWPATNPGEAVLEGVMGFLPNRSREQVMQEIEAAIREEGDPWLRDTTEVQFTFRHQNHVTPPDAPVVETLKQAVRAGGVEPRLRAFPSSSDTWLYQHLLGLPAVIFGPGSLADAHSDHERIELQSLERAEVILGSFFERWCGAPQKP
jgi:acetylornithine deacetylase